MINITEISLILTFKSTAFNISTIFNNSSKQTFNNCHKIKDKIGIFGINIAIIPRIFIHVVNVDTNKFEITKMNEKVLNVDSVIGRIKMFAESVTLIILDRFKSNFLILFPFILQHIL